MEFDFDPFDKDSSELPPIRLKFKPSLSCVMALIPISLKDFADLSDLERFRLILNGIEEAVKIIINKKRGDFEGERMLNDVRNAFEKIKGVKL